MHDVLLPPGRLGRIRSAYRYPEQAAVAARMPLIGRRVPLRSYWRRRPIHKRELLRQMFLSGARPVIERVREMPTDGTSLGHRVRSVGGVAMTAAAETATKGVQAAARGPARMPHVHAPQVHAAAMHVPKLAAGLDKYGGRERHSHDASDYMRRVPRPRARWTVIFAAVGLGALVMYFFDLQSGRRRRALLRDKLEHARNVATRRLPRTIRRRRRFLGGVARGIGHEAAGVVLRDDHHVIVDDDTLVARVRSEVLRSDRWKSGEIHLDAYEGCVTLRGQLEHESEIRKLIEETQRVEGVREVRSYLHLPGTLPPNKAEVYELERVPSHMAAQE